MDSFWIFDYEIDKAISERCLQLMKINAASARDFVKSDYVKNLPDKYRVSLLACVAYHDFNN